VIERVLASSDCERCRPGLVTQPANTVSSLAYVVAGAAMLRSARHSGPSRSTETALAWATIAVGVGSVAYHGPGGTVSRYAHDASLVAMLGFIAWSDAERLAGKRLPAGLAVVPLVAAVGAAPSLSPATQALAGLAAVVAEGARLRQADTGAADGRIDGLGDRPAEHPDRGSRRTAWRPWSPWVAGPALAVGLAAQAFGRTGGPWCRPDSLLQPHALWHVLTAVALWARSAGTRGGTPESKRQE
jgi:hypothetical protein